MLNDSHFYILSQQKDISVVHLSAEAAPADLPAPGDIVHQQLRAGMAIFAMRNAFGSWLKAKIVEVLPKTPVSIEEALGPLQAV